MTYVPLIHNRQSTRLRGYDYSRAGAYFITLCAWERSALFGDIVNDGVELSIPGTIVRDEWLRSAQIRCELKLDTFVVMPNHLHAVVWLGHKPTRALGALVAGFKAATTRTINEAMGTVGHPVWQRNYHDRIIRDDRELNRIHQYILDNPLKWAQDPNHPANKKH